jgi:hypothetical protein
MKKLNIPIPVRTPAAIRMGAAGIGKPNCWKNIQKKRTEYPFWIKNWMVSDMHFSEGPNGFYQGRYAGITLLSSSISFLGVFILLKNKEGAGIGNYGGCSCRGKTN